LHRSDYFSSTRTFFACSTFFFFSFFFLMIRPSPCSTLFPYTTLFRSLWLYCIFYLILTLHFTFDFYQPVFMIFLYKRQIKFIKRSEEHTSELQSRFDLVCRLLLEKKKIT